MPRLSKLELQIVDALWTRNALSVREVHEAFSEEQRPVYKTVQTMVFRLEGKGACRAERPSGDQLLARAGNFSAAGGNHGRSAGDASGRSGDCHIHWVRAWRGRAVVPEPDRRG